MDNNEKKESFTYTYSAKEQEELKKIRQKYQPKEEDKMELLRRMDAAVTKKATAKALTVGIIGALIMGFGMSIIMTDLIEIFGLTGFQKVSIVLGIIIGIIGMILACLAYPVYLRVLRRERERIAPEVLRLTDELMR